jgi:hypothetical protein
MASFVLRIVAKWTRVIVIVCSTRAQPFVPSPSFAMSLTALLDQSLTLERQTVTSDNSGGSVRTFAQIARAIPCMTEPAIAKVVADYARLDMLVNYHVYTTVDLDMVIPGGVRLGDRLASGSVHYLVKAVKKSANAQITSEVLYQLDCERRVV